MGQRRGKGVGWEDAAPTRQGIDAPGICILKCHTLHVIFQCSAL